MKNIFRSILVAACVAFACTVHADQWYTCLDTYDQLENHVGETGVFFVRDAGNTRTGQHGDPTVRKGYAYYTWDYQAASWKMIGKEELLKLGNIDFTKLMTIDLYREDQENMRDKVDTMSNIVAQATVTIQEMIPILISLTNAFDKATIDGLIADNNRMKSSLEMITNTYISVDSSFGELKNAVSNICAAASFGLGGLPEYRFKSTDEEVVEEPIAPPEDPVVEPVDPAEPAEP